YGVRLGDTAEGQAVLGAPHLVQVAAIHAALEALKDCPDRDASYAGAAQMARQRCWKAREALGTLLRRKHAFTNEDVETLMGGLKAAPDPWDHDLAAPEILRGLSKVVTPDRWTIDQLATLRGMLDRLTHARLPYAYSARGERLKFARLLRDLL